MLKASEIWRMILAPVITILFTISFQTLGNNCTNPYTISSLPFTYSGTLCGEGDDFPDPICGLTGWGGSEDFVFEVYLEAGSTYEFSATVGSGNVGIFIFADCNTTSCILRYTITGSSSLTFCWTPRYTDTFYVVIDRDVTGCDVFSFSLTETTAAGDASQSQTDIYTCSGTYYDDGGPTCDYSDPDISSSLTICPSTPGQCVQVDFNSFTLDNSTNPLSTFGVDLLAVLDGSKCDNEVLAVFDGSNPPTAPVTASGLYGNGCLTFLFIPNDDGISAAGWDATISCVPCTGTPITGTSVNMTTGYWEVDCNTSSTFYDSGGPLGDYANDEYNTLRICPNTAGKYVQLDFTAFDIESGFDFLTIYNGKGICNSCEVYTGTTSPGTVASSASSGCLTAIFDSDGSVTRPGWEAIVTCIDTPGLPLGTIGASCGNPICLPNTDPYTITTAERCATFFFSGCGAFTQGNWGTFFVFTIQNPGTLQFTLTPSPSNTDLDFALFQLPSLTYSCTNLPNPIRSSFSANTGITGLAAGSGDFCEPFTGDAFVEPVSVNTGEAYLLFVNNFSENGASFTLDFTGTTATFDPSICPTALSESDIHAFVIPQKEGNLISWLTGNTEINYFKVVKLSDKQITIASNIKYNPNQIVYTVFDPSTEPGVYRYVIEGYSQDNTIIASALVYTVRQADISQASSEELKPTILVATLENKLEISSPTDIKHIKLFTIDGKLILSANIPEFSTREFIDLPNYSNSLIIVEVTTESGTYREIINSPGL